MQHNKKYLRKAKLNNINRMVTLFEVRRQILTLGKTLPQTPQGSIKV